MKKKLIAMVLAICLIISLLPSAAFADTTQKIEFVAVDKQCIKSIADDGRTIILKSSAPKPDSADILSVENDYPFYLAEKITEGFSVKYVVIENVDEIKCVEEGISLESKLIKVPKDNFWMHGEGNDEFKTYCSYLFAEETGVYTLEYKDQQVKIEISIPECWFYTEPEATIKNQLKDSFRYDSKKENILYMILTNPERYSSLEYSLETEKMQGAATLEQMGDLGEICKITVNDPIDYFTVRCSKSLKTGEKYSQIYQFHVEKKPSKVSLVSFKSSKQSRVTVKWKEQDVYGYHVKIATNSKFTKNVKNYYVKDATSKTIKGLKSGKKYYVKVRAYNMANGKYYGSWSNYKSVTCK